LLNNYKQATNIISSYTPEIEQFKAATGFGDDDFNKWPAEELVYLQNLRTEPAADTLAMDYVEALQNVEKLQ